MISAVTARAPAKCNLVLHTSAPRADHYHPLLTLFQAVDLWEHVTLRLRPQPGVAVTVSGIDAHRVPLDATNLAVRAVKLVAAVSGISKPAVDISITKNIPVAGGLAGGSADAAAALVAANHLWQSNLGQATLHSLAAQLGSDVNFCLTGGTAIGRGRGEQLEPLTCGRQLHWVLITAPTGLSTQTVFQRFDQLHAAAPPGTVAASQNNAVTSSSVGGAGQGQGLPDDLPSGLRAAITAGDPVEIGKYLTNDLQAAAVSLDQQLGTVLQKVSQLVPCSVVLSGSGPSVIALAKDAKHAASLADQLTVRLDCHTVQVVTAPVGGAEVLQP